MAAVRIQRARTCHFVEAVQDQEVGREGASQISRQRRKEDWIEPGQQGLLGLLAAEPQPDCTRKELADPFIGKISEPTHAHIIVPRFTLAGKVRVGALRARARRACGRLTEFIPR